MLIKVASLYYPISFHQFVAALCLSGHSDWVRDVQFVCEREEGDLLLASCSQDTSIRLWRISRQQQQQQQDSKQCPPQDDELRLKGNVFTLSCGVSFVVTLESILMGEFEFESTNQIDVAFNCRWFKGHEDWVYSICWSSTDQSDCREQCIQLLSSSMDKTLILWKPDPASGVWLEEVKAKIQTQSHYFIIFCCILGEGWGSGRQHSGVLWRFNFPPGAVNFSP